MDTNILKLNGLSWVGEELDKKFRDSYVYAYSSEPEHSFSPQVVYIAHCGAENLKCSIDKTGKTSKIISYKNFFLLEDRPNPCLSNIGKDKAFMFLYNPNRQWKRGFGKHNCYCFSYDNFQNWNISFNIAENIVNPKHLHLDEALLEFKDKEVQARVLNNRYWLIKIDKNSSIKLYRRKTFIGSIIGKRFFINESAKIFKRELQIELPILQDKYAHKS